MLVFSFGAAIDEPQSDAPLWLSKVPVMSSNGQRAFQFRTRVGVPPQLTFYTSWAPPDRCAMVFCDSHDGLPLIYVVDGDGWVYDLVAGQIVHYKLDPKFKFGVSDGQFNFNWGFAKSDDERGIQVDFVSFLKAPNIVSFKSTVEATRRTTLGMTARGSKVLLEARLSDPPLPERFVLALPPNQPPSQIECDGFHYDEPLPPWHRTLEPGMLAKDVPYLDATDVKDAPKDNAGALGMAAELLFGEATFLIRPALRDPTLRSKVQQMSSKIDFQQIELHEKLLKDAWLRALAHQGIEPAKSFGPPGKDNAPGN
jgi:hypothetical protein